MFANNKEPQVSRVDSKDVSSNDQQQYEFLFDLFSCSCTTDREKSCLHSISPFSKLGTHVLLYYYLSTNSKMLTQPLSLKYEKIHGYTKKMRNGSYSMFVKCNNITHNNDLYNSIIHENIQLNKHILYTTNIRSISDRYIIIHSNNEKIAKIRINSHKDTYTLIIDNRDVAVIYFYNKYLYNGVRPFSVLVPNTLFYSNNHKSIIKRWKKERKNPPCRSILGVETFKRSIDVYNSENIPHHETMDDDSSVFMSIVDKNLKRVFSYKDTTLVFENPFSPLIAFVIHIAILDS